jgi:hypothetical protein
LKVEDGKGSVIGSNGNGKVLKGQYIPYTDFTADEATVWVVDKVMLLPNEY